MDDFLDDSPQAIEARRVEAEKYKQELLDYHSLVNTVFSTAEGKKILERWTKEHVFAPTVIIGQPLESHGIKEGKASFVRDIHEILDLVQNNYYQPEEQ